MGKVFFLTLLSFIILPVLVHAAEDKTDRVVQRQIELLEQARRNKLAGVKGDELGKLKAEEDQWFESRALIASQMDDTNRLDPETVVKQFGNPESIQNKITREFGENFQMMGLPLPSLVVWSNTPEQNKDTVLFFNKKGRSRSLLYQNKIPLKCTLGLEDKGCFGDVQPFVVVLYQDGHLVQFRKSRNWCSTSWRPTLVTTKVNDPENIDNVRAFPDKEVLLSSPAQVTILDKKGNNLWSWHPQNGVITRIAFTQYSLAKVAALSSENYLMEWTRNKKSWCSRVSLCCFDREVPGGLQSGQQLDYGPARVEYSHAGRLLLNYDATSGE